MGFTIVITGASSGLGKATANFLAQKGHKVIGTCRQPDAYATPENFEMLALDMNLPESIEQFTQKIQSQKQKIDVLINNAGVGITGPAEEIKLDAIRQHFETNFFGPIALTQALLPLLRLSKQACIVNVTSIAGYSGLPFRSIYSASKSAFSIFSEALRMELRSANIRVATIAPGDYATAIATRRHHAPVKKGSAYETIYGAALATMDDHVDSGSDPIIIAQQIEKIIHHPHPKVHYLSGKWLQKFSVTLKGILPSRWFEKLLRNHYKI